METDELIAALAADDTAPKRPRLVWRLLPGAVVSVILMALFWGVRPDWGQAVQNLPVLTKQGLPVVLLLLAALLLRQGAPGRKPMLGLFAGIAGAVALAWGIAVLQGGDIMGQSAWQCLLSIPVLALPMAVPLFWGLRHRVEPQPARTGMVAGLFAGAAGAAIYALHCDEDSAAFFLLWYGLGIAACGVAGRIAGARLLGV